jgi:hypothetical protein
MSEYEYDQPAHDEPTADYPPADQYDSLIGQPLDGGFAEPHHEQTVGGFTANDGYGPDVVNYDGAEHPEGYAGAGEGAGYGEGGDAPAYAGAEGHDPAYAGGEQPEGHEPAYASGDQPEGEPNYAADGGEYAQPTQGTSTSGTSAQ